MHTFARVDLDVLTAAYSNALSYSPANRLASATGAWGTSTYSYDSVGNRLTDVTGSITNASTIATTSNRITGMTQNAAALRTYSYDGAGNITQDIRPGAETFVYSYNNRNRLAGVTRNGVAYGTYLYNASEQLASRNTGSAPGGPVGTVHYIYDRDGHLIAEADGATGATLREYIWLPANDNTSASGNDTLAEGMGLAANDNAAPDLPLALVDAVNTTPVTYQVHTDHLGRSIRMTDAAKATVWQASYKPWGEVQSITGTVSNTLRFPGQYFQIETGLAYNWHRTYDPVTGRYTQPDPLGFVDGPSIYAYAGSSPFMNVDREGRFFWIVAGIVGGLAIEAAADYLENHCGCADGSGLGDFAASAAAGATVGDNLDPLPKPRKGIGGAGASQVTSRSALLADRIFGSARSPVRLPTPTLKRPFAGSRSLARFAGRWAPIVGGAYIGYDLYRIGRCIASRL